MNNSQDILSIWILNIGFTIRLYKEPNFGIRKLGKYRYTFDLKYISFIFEYYN